MNIVCTLCAHEFEMTDEAAAETGGATKCPSCGGETSLGSIPSGATLPWHPGMDGMPPAVPQTSSSDATEAAGGEAPPAPKEQSVLFKLGEFQAMGAQSSARQGGGPPEASGLLDIRMLAANIHQHELEEQASHNVQFVGTVKPSFPVALPTSSPALVPGPPQSKGKGGLIVAAVVFLMLVVAAGVLVYFVYAGKKTGDAAGEKQASAAMEPAMRPAAMEAMDAMEPVMRPAAMKPAMRPAVMAAMEKTMDPEIMAPPAPKKKPRKLRRKHIKAGVATVADQVKGCKKDRKGRFKLRITVVGKTGKVKRVRISGRKKRRSKTGKCLRRLFKKALFTPFKRRRQSFTHRLRIR